MILYKECSCRVTDKKPAHISPSSSSFRVTLPRDTFLMQGNTRNPGMN